MADASQARNERCAPDGLSGPKLGFWSRKLTANECGVVVAKHIEDVLEFVDLFVRDIFPDGSGKCYTDFFLTERNIAPLALRNLSFANRSNCISKGQL